MTILEQGDPDDRREPEHPGRLPGAAGSAAAGDSPGAPPDAGDDVQSLLERALGLPPGAGQVAVAGRAGAGGPSLAPAAESTGDGVAVPRPAASAPDRRSARWGLAAGLLLVGVLGAAYLVVTHLGRQRAGGTSQSRVDAPAAGAESVAPPADPVDALLARLPGTWRTSCRPAPGLDETAIGAVSCTPPGESLGRVEMRVFGSAARMNERYRHLGAHDLPAPRSGAPRCAAGRREERGWALPESPGTVAGRYACRIEDGLAAMWWTTASSGVLLYAVRTDADLAALFDWWRSAASRGPG